MNMKKQMSVSEMYEEHIKAVKQLHKAVTRYGKTVSILPECKKPLSIVSEEYE